MFEYKDNYYNPALVYQIGPIEAPGALFVFEVLFTNGKVERFIYNEKTVAVAKRSSLIVLVKKANHSI